MLSKFGRQHLDPQELGCGVLANARRGETNIEAVAEAGEEARSGTINGVASKLATGMYVWRRRRGWDRCTQAVGHGPQRST